MGLKGSLERAHCSNQITPPVSVRMSSHKKGKPNGEKRNPSNFKAIELMYENDIMVLTEGYRSPSAHVSILSCTSDAKPRIDWLDFPGEEARA